MLFSGRTTFSAALFALSFMVFGTVAVFSGALTPSTQVKGQVKGASVQSSASVDPNAYNTLAAQLDQKSEQLQSQQLEIDHEQETLDQQRQSQESLLAILIVLVVFFGVLVVYNLYFDLETNKINTGKYIRRTPKKQP